MEALVTKKPMLDEFQLVTPMRLALTSLSQNFEVSLGIRS